VVTVNPEFLVEANHNIKFKRVLNKADLKLPDGFGLVIASNLFKTPLKARVTGIDFVYHLLSLSDKNGYKIFFLGGAEGVAEKATYKIREMYPNLKVFFSEGSTNVRKESEEEKEKTVNEINKSGAEILLVAYGSPWQDLWISENAKYLKSVRVAVGVGGSLDFISGKVRRAPLIFQKLGLEWLFRLIIEPRRIKRIFRAVVVFPIMVILNAVKDPAKPRLEWRSENEKATG